MRLEFSMTTRWAHRGTDIVEYAAGAVIDTDDEELVLVAVAEGWAKLVDAEVDGDQTIDAERPKA